MSKRENPALIYTNETSKDTVQKDTKSYKLNFWVICSFFPLINRWLLCCSEYQWCSDNPVSNAE